MKGFKTLEEKYGIGVVEDDIYNPLTGRTLKRFKIYAADGCLWENGLTREGVKKECEMYGTALLEIKNNEGRWLYE